MKDLNSTLTIMETKKDHYVIKPQRSLLRGVRTLRAKAYNRAIG